MQRPFTITAPRPLGEAAHELSFQYGILISHEDPPLRFSGDLEEFTLQNGPNRIVRDPNKKLLGSRTATVSATLNVFTDSESLVDVDEVLSDLLKSNEANGNPGRFKVIKGKDAWHIVPTAVKDEQGKWVPVTPLLDNKISLTPEPRKAQDVVLDICHQLSLQSNSNVFASFPGDRLRRQTVAVAANNEPARDVLIRLLDNVDGHYTWRLYYDHNLNSCALNIELLTETIRRKVNPAANPSTQPDN